MARTCRVGVFLVGCLLASRLEASSIVVSFEPVSQTVFVGQSASVDLVVSGLEPGVSVGSFDLFVAFDPTIVGASDAVFGLYLGDPSAFEALTRTDFISVFGEVEVAEDSLLSPSALTALQDPVRSTGFVLATLTFAALAPGVSPLRIELGIAADQNGTALDVIGGAGSITVLPVPEPDAVALMVLGIGLVLRGLEKRRRAL
jgi:hypothetical protein